MRASRLLSIAILLQVRGRLTAEHLADEFGVSVRTIYRDVDDLSAAGIPVYGDRGPGGGFQLLDGYRTRLTGLATDEAQALFMIGLPGPAAALGLGSASARAGRKLLAALPEALGEDARRIGTRFHLDPVDWYRAAEPVPLLPELARAVLDQRRVSMTYESWKTTRDWQIEPLGLVLKAGAWYVVARTGKGVRIFKVSKILQLVAQQATFDRPEEFELAAFWSAELERFEAGLRPQKASLRASPAGLARLSRLGSYAARAASASAPPDADGWTRVLLPIESVNHAALAFLGLGPEVEVLEPVALRDRLRMLAEDVVRHNAGISKPEPRARRRGV
jgi:predicted DNA-binding transcriptional regulator YafY